LNAFFEKVNHFPGREESSLRGAFLGNTGGARRQLRGFVHLVVSFLTAGSGNQDGDPGNVDLEVDSLFKQCGGFELFIICCACVKIAVGC
jgi:hypothetical protein